MSLGYVYLITNPVGHTYVGSTISIRKRLSSYRNNNIKNQIKISRSIEKYGFPNHIFEVVWCGDPKIRYTVERMIGESVGATDRIKGLNLELPGYDDVPKFQSDETKAKFVASYKWKPLPKEVKAKMSKNSLRIKPSKETIAKVRIALMRPIEQYDLDGSFIKEYCSAVTAANELNIGRSNIKNNLNGYSKSANGFIFKFKDRVKKGPGHKKVKQMDMHGNIIAVHNSISEAARSVDVDFSSIRYVIRGFGKTAAGYKWEAA